MKKYFVALLLTNLTLLTACGEPEAPTVGQNISFDTACDRTNDGKRVAVEGFLTLPTQIKRDILVLRLRQSPEIGGQVIGVSSQFGSGVNQAAPVPTVYKHRDLKVQTNDGQNVGYLDKVRVSGNLYFPISTSVEFKCALSNPLIEQIK